MKEIKIGFPVPLTGAFGPDAEEQVLGAKLAVDLFNAAGGFNGHMAQLLVRDTEGKSDLAGSKTEELITKDKVDFVIGALSAVDLMVISEVCHKHGIVYNGICVSDSSLEPQNRRPYFFHEGTTAHLAVNAVGRYVFSRVGRRIALLTCKVVTFEKYFLRPLYTLAKAIRVDIVANPMFAPGTADLRPFLREIEAQKPEVLILNSFGLDQRNSIMQAVELGLNEKMRLVCPSLAERQRLLAGPEVYEHVIGGVPYYWHLQDRFESARLFNEAYSKANDGLMPTSYSAYGYTATRALLTAAQNAKSLSSDKLAKALRSLRFDFCRGPQMYRRLDHQTVMPYLIVESKPKSEMQNDQDYYNILDFTEFLGPRLFHISAETE